MAKITVSGMVEALQAFDKLVNMPQSVIDEMLNAEADVFVPQIKENARTMLQGPFWQGAVAESTTKLPPEDNGLSRHLDITFEGYQHGNRVTEIAFVNEYGTSGQPARPFMRAATESKLEEATEKAAAVLFDYEKNIGL